MIGLVEGLVEPNVCVKQLSQILKSIYREGHDFQGSLIITYLFNCLFKLILIFIKKSVMKEIVHHFHF